MKIVNPEIQISRLYPLYLQYCVIFFKYYQVLVANIKLFCKIFHVSYHVKICNIQTNDANIIKL
jgi:hypothetical protein